jgi:tripartite-type tricarboxylate transporter receptor subunit TctC
MFVKVVLSVYAVLCLATGAIAQNYPVKSIRFIVGFPPGGTNDIVARALGQKLTEQMGQQFVIENRGGASGIVGSELVAKSPPDGYVLMVQSATHVANPHLFKKVPFDTLKDFTGLTPLAAQVGMVVVHPSLPAKTVRDLVAIARAKPDQLIYGSSGNGSFVHLAMALIASMSDTKMVHVPYKGGGPAVIALMAGEIQAMTATVGSVVPYLESKRLRALAVTSATRVKPFPDIPTVGESGVKGYEFTAWIGAFAPANMPRPLLDRLNGELKKALDSAEVSKTLGAQTLEPMYMTPEQFAERLKVDYAKYQKLVKLTGVQLD